jgi:hypothetical protein
MHETAAGGSCLGFGIDCQTLWQGLGVTVAGFILFVGSVYILLAAVFGRYMGYLMLAVGFTGWMVIQSAMWLFGFWAQGPETPLNLGPRGDDPAWRVLAAGLAPHADEYALFDAYPDGWVTPDEEDPEWESDIQSARGAAVTFLSREVANGDELGETPEEDTTEIASTAQFIVDRTSFTTADDGTRLAVVEAHFAGGGPRAAVSLHFHQGNVPMYSIIFLIGSIILFVVHVPLLDRAERSRREFLTGGSTPAWYGPA